MNTVIEMARLAGLAKYGNGLREGIYPFMESLERFAELVRADERARLQPKKIKATTDDYCQGDERYYSNE